MTSRSIELLGYLARLLKPSSAAKALVAYVLYKILHQLVLWPYLLSPLRHLPGPSLGNPLLGQFPTILKEGAGVPQRRWLKQHGPVVRAVGPIGIERLIFIKPEALRKILVSDWLDHPRPGFFQHLMGICAGYGLFTVTGSKHKMMRKVMNPAFSINNLAAQLDIYYDLTNDFIKIINSQIDAEPDPSQGKEYLVYHILGKLTLDIICEAAFGYKPDTIHDPSNPLAEAYEEFLDIQSGPNLASFFFVLSIPGVPALLTSDWAYRHRHWFHKVPALAPIGICVDTMYRINIIAKQILAERMADSNDVTSHKRDVMSFLLRARSNEKGQGYKMSDADMAQQILTFLLAGHETTASGLAWTLWSLAKNVAVQDTLRKEVLTMLADSPRPDYRILKDSPWLDAVVMESLRLNPPVPSTVRKTAKDVEIDGVFVPKNTLLYIPILLFNTSKEHWGDDAEIFRPERWFNLPESYDPTFSLLTFIAGPHGCIGKTMSIMEMKAVLALLIANFEFDLVDPDQVAKPRTGVTTKPSDGLPLRIRKVVK